MAKPTYWERAHTASTGGAPAVKGVKTLSTFAAGNTLGRTLWSATLLAETESLPAPLRPMQVACGIYDRAAGSGLVLYPFDHEDDGRWISRRIVSLRPHWYTTDNSGVLLAVQRGGDTGYEDVQSEGQRTDPVSTTELIFSWQVDGPAESAAREVWYSVASSFLILIG